MWGIADDHTWLDYEERILDRGPVVSASRAAPPVIGVFAAQLDDAYQIAVWRGVETRARERGVGVVCFLGHRIGSPIAIRGCGERRVRDRGPPQH